MAESRKKEWVEGPRFDPAVDILILVSRKKSGEVAGGFRGWLFAIWKLRGGEFFSTNVPRSSADSFCRSNCAGGWDEIPSWAVEVANHWAEIPRRGQRSAVASAKPPAKATSARGGRKN